MVFVFWLMFGRLGGCLLVLVVYVMVIVFGLYYWFGLWLLWALGLFVVVV